MEHNNNDLTALALYHLAISKYLEMKKIVKELEKHLDENYIMEECLCSEDFISDSIYGDEANTETFMRELNASAIRK